MRTTTLVGFLVSATSILGSLSAHGASARPEDLLCTGKNDNAPVYLVRDTDGSLQRLDAVTQKDGAYGLGGVTFHGSVGASATFGTADKGDVGKKVSRFDVYYMEQPDGGNVEKLMKLGSCSSFFWKARLRNVTTSPRCVLRTRARSLPLRCPMRQRRLQEWAGTSTPDSCHPC